MSVKHKISGFFSAVIIAAVSFFVIFFFFQETSVKFFGVSFKTSPEAQAKVAESKTAIKEKASEAASETLSHLSDSTSVIKETVSERLGDIFK